MDKEFLDNANAQDIKKYKKIDSPMGFLTDALEIDVEKTRRYKDEVFNDMLGSFNDEGEYIIPQEILEELVKMPKFIDVINDNGIEARGYLGDRAFYFAVTPVVELEDGTAYCYLQLREKMERMAGFYIDIHTTVVATYSYKFDKMFDQNMRNIFNLKDYDSDSTEGRTFFADHINHRLKLLAAIREEGDELYEKLEEVYFNHRIKLLGLSPETALIMADFVNRKNKLEPFINISKRKFYALNQILDDVLADEKCKECLEKSAVFDQMKNLDRKMVDKTNETKERVENSRTVIAVKEAKRKDPFIDLDDLSKGMSAPTVEPKPKKKPEPGLSYYKHPPYKPAKSGGKDKKDKDKGKAKGGGGAPSKASEKDSMVIGSLAGTSGAGGASGKDDTIWKSDLNFEMER